MVEPEKGNNFLGRNNKNKSFQLVASIATMYFDFQQLFEVWTNNEVK